MLYLYTILTLAWDLDKDTHEYFREILNVFVNHRKISKEVREFKKNAADVSGWWGGGVTFYPHHFHNPLRYGLGICKNIFQTGELKTSMIIPIDQIHPEKYYVAGIIGRFVYWAPYDYPENTDAGPEKWTIRFPVKEEYIKKYCKEIGKNIPNYTDEYYFPYLTQKNKSLSKKKQCFPTERDLRICLMRLEDS